jgi:hypothetical protein
MPDEVISMTSYQHGFNSSQPDRDGSNWQDSWPSIDMLRVRDAINYWRMRTFSIVIVGKLYQGRDVVSRVGAITDMTSFMNAMYPGSNIYPGRFMQIPTELTRPPGGNTEEIAYKALDLMHMPVKIVGVILQKIS